MYFKHSKQPPNKRVVNLCFCFLNKRFDTCINEKFEVKLIEVFAAL